MKAIPVLAALFLISASVSGQDFFKEGTEFRIGATLYDNFLNDDFYLDDRFDMDRVPYTFGVHVEVLKETSIKHLHLIAGMAVEYGNLGSSTTGFPVARTEESTLTGGGIYLGINPKFGNENIGLTSTLALGYFTYRERNVMLDFSNGNSIDIREIRSTGGLGATSSLGVYLRLKGIGVTPALSLAMSGNQETNFVFYGVKVPVTFYF